MEKIKYFIWKIAPGMIPSGNQVQKYHGRGDGRALFVIFSKIRITPSLIVFLLNFAGLIFGKLLGAHRPSRPLSPLNMHLGGHGSI
jgi:hypothetical protein